MKDDSQHRLSVEALGALCELDSGELGGSPGFKIGEFADLNDGRRIFWKEDRGWGGGSNYLCHLGYLRRWPITSGRDLTYEVIMVTDTDDHRIDSYVEWVFECLREMELNVDPVSVYCAPFRVEFGPSLAVEMDQVARLFDLPARSKDRVSPSAATTSQDTGRVMSIGDDETERAAWPAPALATDRGNSDDIDEDQAGLQVKMPRELIERLVVFCHDQQTTASTVVERLVRKHLDDRRH